MPTSALPYVKTATQTYIQAGHVLDYRSDGPVTPAALAESLSALDGIVKCSLAFIDQLVPDNGIVGVEVLITEVKAGSYRESFIVRLLFGHGRKAEKNIERLRQILGVNKVTPETMVRTAVYLTISWACILSYKALHPDNKETPYAACAASVALKREPKEIAKMAADAFGVRRVEVITVVTRFVYPSEDTRPGILYMGGPVETDIYTDELSRLSPPTDYNRAGSAETSKDLEGVEITIRAINLNRPAQGCLAVIPTLDQRALPLRFNEGIDPAAILAGKIGKVDVTVFFAVDEQGNKVPRHYLLRKVHPPITVKVQFPNPAKAANSLKARRLKAAVRRLQQNG